MVNQEISNEAVDIDWEMDQELPVEENLTEKPRYGFNDQYQNYFQPLQDELSEILEIPNPDGILPCFFY